jgi:glycosyltransferase involved in cell wall biosynthesis
MNFSHDPEGLDVGSSVVDGVIAVGAFPPPVAGQSIAMKILNDFLRSCDVPVRRIDISEPLESRGWLHTLYRALRLLVLPLRVITMQALSRPRRPVLYLQLGHGSAAIIRDLPLLIAARLTGLPTVGHIHGAGYERAVAGMPAVLKVLYRWALRPVHVIVLSELLRRAADNLVGPSRVTVVENGVEPELAVDAVQFIRTTNESAPLNVLFLSNLIVSKGYVSFLEAAREAYTSGDLNCDFVLAGRRTDQTTVEPSDFVDRHGLNNLQYVGPASPAMKRALFRRADVLVLPSTYPLEAQPIVLLEALHYGVPPITFPTGAIPDIVRHAVNGLLMNPSRDPALEIIDAVTMLDRDRGFLAAMARNCIDVARDRYTPEGHGRRVLEVLARVSVSSGTPRV